MKKLLLILLTVFIHTTYLYSSPVSDWERLEDIRKATEERDFNKLRFLLSEIRVLKENRWGSSLSLSSIQPFLREAIQERDLEKVRLWVKYGPHINYYDTKDFPRMGKSMLAEAIDTSSVGVVKILLEAGALVTEDATDLPFEKGVTLNTRWTDHLCYAIVADAPVEIIKLLMGYAQDFSRHYGYVEKRTAYDFAEYYGKTEIMALLENAVAKKRSA